MAKTKSEHEEMVRFNTAFSSPNTNKDDQMGVKHLHRKQKKQSRTCLYICCCAISLLLLGITGYMLYEVLHRDRNSKIFKINDDKNNSEKDELDFRSIFSYPNCGTRTCEGRSCKRRARRLIDGMESIAGAWPWMVEIVIDGKHVCGATVLNQRYVLTAAHCLYAHNRPIDEELVHVVFGKQNRIHNNTLFRENKVCSFTIHERFNRETLENDIALIKLKRKIIFNDNIRPACLPKHVSSTTEGTMIGWGKTAINKPFSAWLLELKVPLVPYEQCSESNDNIYRTIKVDPYKNLCVGYGEKRSEYACTGDSGGGYFQQTKQNRWYVQGLISWIDPSCNAKMKKSYTVLTCVTCFERWLGQNMDFDFLNDS